MTGFGSFSAQPQWKVQVSCPLHCTVLWGRMAGKYKQWEPHLDEKNVNIKKIYSFEWIVFAKHTYFMTCLIGILYIRKINPALLIPLQDPKYLARSPSTPRCHSSLSSSVEPTKLGSKSLSLRDHSDTADLSATVMSGTALQMRHHHPANVSVGPSQ